MPFAATITTARLILRPLTDEVYKDVFKNYNEEELKIFFGCWSEDDLAEERKKYEQGLKMYRKSLLLFQLIEKVTNKVIGWCGYHTWYLPHNRAEIGYVMTDEESKGKGYMKEALSAVLEYGFGVMNLHRIEAFVGKGNEPSLKLLKQYGFTYEGVLREHYYVHGVYENSLLFSLLKHEYKSLQEITTDKQVADSTR